jgi:hypothetical protein
LVVIHGKKISKKVKRFLKNQQDAADVDCCDVVTVVGVGVVLLMLVGRCSLMWCGWLVWIGWVVIDGLDELSFRWPNGQ